MPTWSDSSGRLVRADESDQLSKVGKGSISRIGLQISDK